MLISNFLVLRIAWKREQNIMIDSYGPYGVPFFLCIWDYNLALYGYFHIFFDKLWCKLHYRKLDILSFFFFLNKKDLVSNSCHLSSQKKKLQFKIFKEITFGRLQCLTIASILWLWRCMQYWFMFSMVIIMFITLGLKNSLNWSIYLSVISFLRNLAT